MDNKKLDIAFLWHMHQPSYKDDRSGEYLMPWVRLRGVKDYFPMARLVESFNNVRVTFNLVPALIEQLNDYALNNASDPLLNLTLKKASSLSFDDKVDILDNFFRVNFNRFIYPNARYTELLLKKGVKPLGKSALKKVVNNFSTRDILDLQVLFNLSWFHSISVDEDQNLKDIILKGHSYTEEDKAYCLSKQRDILRSILPLYKRLKEEGRIEISTSPYYHPILPLLCDTSISKISSYGNPLPKKRFKHPEDALWHIEEAIRYYAEQFGSPPQGMWPSEGSVSNEALELMAHAGIHWVATDEDILFKSLSLYDKRYKTSGFLDRRLIYQPYKFKSNSKSINMIFRDKNLSDLISFTYNAWDQKAAAEDLLGHFKRIGENLRRDGDRGMVSIVMDGENAWEYFEDNARTFFESLYGALNEDSLLAANTVSECLKNNPPRKSISNIFPASWINHNFEVWIGTEQDNVSWDYLSAVRKDLMKFTKEARKGDAKYHERVKAAWREFHIAEGSDWNWWYSGSLNPYGSSPFDKLYRTHLNNVYKALGKKAPEILNISIA